MVHIETIKDELINNVHKKTISKKHNIDLYTIDEIESTLSDDEIKERKEKFETTIVNAGIHHITDTLKEYSTIELQSIVRKVQSQLLKKSVEGFVDAEERKDFMAVNKIVHDIDRSININKAIEKTEAISQDEINQRFIDENDK